MNAKNATAALNAAGFLGSCKLSDIQAAGLLAELYAAEAAGLARYAGCVGFDATARPAVYFYILAA